MKQISMTEAERRFGKLIADHVAKTFKSFSTAEGVWHPVFNFWLERVEYRLGDAFDLDEPDISPNEE